MEDQDRHRHVVLHIHRAVRAIEGKERKGKAKKSSF